MGLIARAAGFPGFDAPSVVMVDGSMFMVDERPDREPLLYIAPADEIVTLR
jgi:hypothetical protein